MKEVRGRKLRYRNKEIREDISEGLDKGYVN